MCSTWSTGSVEMGPGSSGWRSNPFETKFKLKKKKKSKNITNFFKLINKQQSRLN